MLILTHCRALNPVFLMEYAELRHKYRWFQSLDLTRHKAQIVKKIMTSSSELQVLFNWASKLLGSAYAISY